MSGQHADPQEILLDGKHYRLTAPMNEVNLNTWPGKTVIGDYSKDSNEILSTWVIGDVTGGNGVQRFNTAVDGGRYSAGGIYTRFPYQFTLPWVWDKSAPISSANAYYPLGSYDLANSGTFKWYAVSGTTLMADDASLGLTALTASPVSKGAEVFRGTNNEPLLFIPMGASGYATYRIAGPTVTNVAASGTTPAALWFLVWDDKLICLDTAGQLWRNTGTTSGGWVSYGPTAKLPKGENHWPVGLVAFVNALGDPTVHVVTRLGLWAFDAAGPKLWRTKCEFPAHPYAGNSFCPWRGDLYIAAGMDVIQWNGSVQRNIGLSRDNGLPYVDADGYIIDIEPSLNSITASVFDTHTGSTIDYSAHEWSGLGWHQIWRGAATGETPTWARMGRDNGGIFQHLYVGLAKNGRLRQQQPVSFANPRALKSSALQTFGYNGSTGIAKPWTFETGRSDMGMAGYKKLGNAVQVYVDQYPLEWAIYVDYRIDGATNWTALPQVVSLGLNTLLLGTPSSNNIYPGIGFTDIELRLRYELVSTFTGATPVVEFLTLTYKKLRKSSFSWVAQFDLSTPQDDRSPEQILTDVVALMDAERFIEMEYCGVLRRVSLAQQQGSRHLGADERNTLTLNIIEIPHGSYPSDVSIPVVAGGS